MAILALIGLPATASAQALVLALSTEEVEVASNFTGAELTVFGAAITNQGENDDVIVVLRGPAEPVAVRRKEQLIGLWVNRAREQFTGAPAFFALHTSIPSADIADAETLEGFRLSLPALIAAAAEHDAATAAGFIGALIRLRRDMEHYVEEIDETLWIGPGVFRTAFTLPADVPVGRYRVEAYVFRSGDLVASASQTMDVTKSGAEAFIHNASIDYAFLYALAVVAIAITAGWIGGTLFRRD